MSDYQWENQWFGVAIFVSNLLKINREELAEERAIGSETSLLRTCSFKLLQGRSCLGGRA